ncbi:MAG: PIG-L family deacetylase, partial [Gemmatimonadetes bacterium]|nr:PIG-L family deacetylase [Gemmatimonadota bacterium]NIR37574.1 PIG-L family deacetylase [Actinomycetota bacterium]NIS32079.1 PIG-L family deacetylase [Actinomycetota bacterium]NIU67149.1 PIG-L family deacetylase [Actinomycetota bacterium]NIW28928.1 PIG-L family deacetylase [Actinomycetota bacterium]
DDESFGLGGIIASLVAAGVPVDVLCFTHGEASTLGRGAGVDLGRLRAAELEAAGRVLGVERTVLWGWPDGGLAACSLAELTPPVADLVAERSVDALLVFDESGVTGHPDHRRATQVARRVADRRGIAVYGWTVPDDVADRLNREFGTRFAGRPRHQLSWRVPVDRDRQRRA